jgi:hypothetical protein
MKKLYHGIIICALALIAFAVLDVIYMSSDGLYFNKPIDIKNGGLLQTTANTYRIGDEVQATLNFCKNRNIGGVVDWQLIDSYVRFYQAQRVSLPLGCYSVNEDLGLIPSDVHLGTYHFTGLLTFKINSLTTVSYPLYTNDFTVVK